MAAPAVAGAMAVRLERSLRRGALKPAAETGYRLVIATRLKAFITVASQAMAEIWSGVSTAAAAS